MQSTSRLDHAAHLPRLQGESSLFELLLHVSLAKVAQVSSLARRAAVAFGHGQLAQRRGAGPDLLLVALDDRQRLLLRPANLSLAPAGRSSAVSVLDEQVGGADLALGTCGVGAL